MIGGFIFLTYLKKTCYVLHFHIFVIGINDYDDPSLSLEESLLDIYRVDYHYRHLYYLQEAIK